MSRISFLRSNPKKTLGALATVLAATALIGGTGASFSAHSANPANVFTAGVLQHSNSKAGSAVLSITKMKPGDTQSGTVTLTNTGDIVGTFGLTKSALVDTAGQNGGVLSGRLDVEITDTGSNTVVYTGKVGAMGALALGTYAAGEAHTYRFAVSFPDAGTAASDTTGDNAFKGSTLSVQYDFAEVQ